MKKILIAISLFLLVGCNNASKETGFKKLDGEEVVSKVTSKDTFVVMLTSEDCYSCEIFQDEVESTLEKNNVLMYTVSTTDLDQSMMDQVEIALGTYSSWPTLFYVVDGEIAPTNKYEYSLDPEGWKLWMENMGFIKP